jgi:membrane protein required for beta-lactamase induction
VARNARQRLGADNTRPSNAWLLHATRSRRLRNLCAFQWVENRCGPIPILDVILLLLILLEDVIVLLLLLFGGLLIELLVGDKRARLWSTLLRDWQRSLSVS